METSHNLGSGLLIMAKSLTDWMIRFIWIAQLMFAFLVVGVLASALDRDPPITVYPHPSINAQAGHWVAIDVAVARDLTRHCDAEFDRFLFDSHGKRFDLGIGATVSDQMIRQMELRTPGRMKINMLMPPLATEAQQIGRAHV